DFKNAVQTCCAEDDAAERRRASRERRLRAYREDGRRAAQDVGYLRFGRWYDERGRIPAHVRRVFEHGVKATRVSKPWRRTRGPSSRPGVDAVSGHSRYGRRRGGRLGTGG